MAQKNVTRVRMLRHVQGEKKNADTGELETLARDSVVDVSDQFAAELVSSQAAEVVDETKVKCKVAELTHAPAPAPAYDPTAAIAAAVAEAVAAVVASAKK